MIRALFAVRPSPARLLRALVSAAFLASLLACTAGRGKDPPGREELLRNSLPVASAALGAGQAEVARRIYLSLAERFEDAPEPVLGLGYVAFRKGDFPAAERRFLDAAERAAEKPATLAEALLGAGRAALAQSRTPAARVHFERAREFGQGTGTAAWIENGLAVAAALDADHEAAEAHHLEALRLSSGHPRILANYVRTLIAAGRIDDAARIYAGRSPSWWEGEDGRTLSRLIEESRRQAARPPAGSNGRPLRDGAPPARRGGPAE